MCRGRVREGGVYVAHEDRVRGDHFPRPGNSLYAYTCPLVVVGASVQTSPTFLN